VVARELLLSLPNYTLSGIVRDANARLHFDPVHYLPPEIISTIFEHADSNTLISAAIVSKSWKHITSEARLWRRLFVQEGWLYDKDYLENFMALANAHISSLRMLLDPTCREGLSSSIDSREGAIMKHLQEHKGRMRLWMKRGRLGVDKSPITVVASATPSEVTSSQLSISHHDEEMVDINEPDSAGEVSAGKYVFTPLLGSANLLDRNVLPTFDWRYLYRQRRRLENNWTAGRFVNFRLPRHDHPEEAHTQCVYTMQFSPKHVVTGSRDRTIRIWNLETKRLKLPPLTGHRGSVLCLQFDESPGQDVIVSGGSDSDVIIWTFSTGQIFKRLKNAHSESVLNLRFDHRYLITCSKDKTIKLWNRSLLKPTDPEYPRSNKGKDAVFPDYIVDVDNIVNSAALHQVPFLERYTLLMTFIGHNAAVNAIQVYEDEIVSASGDRKIFLWSIKTGQLIRQFGGHTKGIACVQYDGKRIVSGSSDRTVRVFDSSTGAEMAILDGHRDLVRTVQADFADAPQSDEEYATQAREHDQRVLTDIDYRHTHSVNLVTGATLPPGAGGNQWSKIVSGSYDETVMIWKKARNGKWSVIKELRQEDAMRATSGVPLSAQEWGHRPHSAALVAMAQQAQTDLQALHARQSQIVQMHNEALAYLQAATVQASTLQASTSPRIDNGGAETLPTAVPRPAMIDTAMGSAPATGDSSIPFQAPADLPRHSFINTLRTSRPAPGQDPSLSARQNAQASRTPSSDVPATAPRPPTAVNGHRQRQASAANGPPALPHVAGPGHHHHHHHHHGPRAAAAPPIDEADLIGASRVFKLQFNSRYIICCSQQAVIVGWDFANGDNDIEEASALFAMPESTA